MSKAVFYFSDMYDLINLNHQITRQHIITLVLLFITVRENARSQFAAAILVVGPWGRVHCDRLAEAVIFIYCVFFVASKLTVLRPKIYIL